MVYDAVTERMDCCDGRHGGGSCEDRRPKAASCGCGRSWTLEEYLALPVPTSVKVPGKDAQYVPSFEGDDELPACGEYVLLFRDCPCGSSHAVELEVRS